MARYEGRSREEGNGGKCKDCTLGCDVGGCQKHVALMIEVEALCVCSKVDRKLLCEVVMAEADAS